MEKSKSKYKVQFDYIRPGSTINYWQILDNYLEYVNGKLCVYCKCLKCNQTVTYVQCEKILTNSTKQCKLCHLKDINPSGEFFEPYKGIIGTVFNNIKKGAKERGIEFEITIEDIGDLFEKQKNKCALSGIELFLKKDYLDITATASLDRIDSGKGYTVDNIQWVHKDINFMKRHFEETYFLDLCNKIVENSILKRRNKTKNEIRILSK